MAGSLNHIVSDAGAFTVGNIDNLGDACEALEECFRVIATMMAGMSDADLAAVCAAADVVTPKHVPVYGLYDDE